MQPELSTTSGAGIPVGLRRRAEDESVAKNAKGHAAGVMFVAPDGDVLMLRRSSSEPNYGGHWALPGGKVEDGETPDQGARREAEEEMGGSMENRPLKLVDRRMTPTGMAFHTFAHPVEKKFQPKLNGEHEGFTWAPLGELPRPLHPGVEATLKDRLGTTDDMTPEDWAGLRDGFLKFLSEEEAEPEHTEDTIPKTGDNPDFDAFVQAWSDKYPTARVNFEELKKKFDAQDSTSGKLNEKERAEADRGEKSREDMPESAFLEPTSRKYPVKAKVDGEWKYTSNLLLAAARRARMEKDESLAKRADEIRAREFGAEDELTATDSALRLALDKDSVREFDRDGRLHVSVANICKACISPYKGSEIPGGDRLGLDPDKIYQMFRPPEELERSAATTNGMQILRKHIPVSSEDHQPWDVIGSVGTTAEFVDPFIKNGLTIWTEPDIKDIVSKKKFALSPGYHYEPVMEPGTFGSERFDGSMKNLEFNHLAVVVDGRQGDDVVIGDSAEEMQWAVVENALTEFFRNA